MEHIEKWYCFSCNTYQDEVPEEKAAETPVVVEQPVVEAPKAAEPVVEEAKPSPIAAEIEEIEKEEAQSRCDKCGAVLQENEDGSMSCAMCAPSPAPAAEAEAPSADESKAPSIIDIAIAEQLSTPVKAEPEPVKVEEAPKAVPEVKLEAVETKVRMCPNCGQPLKFIDKYSRYYCYSCKKYAPKEQPETPKAAPAAKAPEGKKCPDCGSDLKYIEKYTEWYCYTCKKYPLRQRKLSEKKAEEKPTEKPAAVAVAAPKPVEKTAGPPMCPKCGKPLKHVEKYDRHYCFECKQYAPKGHGQAEGAKQEKKTCPVCEGDMTYIQQYNEWYCYKCKKYTLRPSKPVLLI